MEPTEHKIESISERLTRSPAFRNMLLPLENSQSKLNDTKIRRLYLQAASQQWFAPDKLNFDRDINVSPEVRRALQKFMRVFFTLEKMGLQTIMRMAPKAVAKFKSDDVSYYLATQTYDESRHVFAIVEYLRKLGAPPKYDRKLEPLNRAANAGIYQVENWLFSTLFSETFAAAFIRRMKSFDEEPLVADLCKHLLIDESRHLHFLHISLPDVLDKLSLLGKGYIKISQFFIMKFTELAARAVSEDALILGIKRVDMLEEVFEQIEKAYDGFGVTKKFLYFPKIRPAY